MSKAIRGHNLGATVALVLIAALLLLVSAVFVARQVVTTGDRAGGNAGSSLARDLAIERHADVVARYRAGAPAMNQNYEGGSSITRDPNIERHAEVVAKHNRGLPQ